MPREAHTIAAHLHEKAAQSHRAAAEQSSKGAHEASEQYAGTACGHSTKADEASKFAYRKSAERLKAVPVGAK